MAAVLVLCIGTHSVTAAQPKVAWPTTHYLPMTADIAAARATNYTVRIATAADFMGQLPQGIPAWQVRLTKTDVGDNPLPPAAVAPPAFIAKIPTKFRSKIALFQGDDLMRWQVVPKGWHLQNAVEGADGTSGITFVAPDGASHGWLTIGYSPANMTNILSGGEGLFPSAHRRFDAFFHVQTPAVTLVPKPDALTHPNRCTARLSYRSGNLVVKGLQLWQPMQLDRAHVSHDPYLIGIYVALPARDVALQNFLVKAFQETQPVWRRFCPSTGW
ncbi:MAG: hypothetical protein ABI114_05400 [Rhodanobacter sp.]